MERKGLFFFRVKRKLDKARIKELKKIAKRLGLRFKNLDVINQAFIHRSYAFERSRKDISNERLEFLGDSVLGLIVSEYLFLKHSFLQEGQLSKLKSQLVNWHILVRVAERISLGNLLLLGKGEEHNAGRQQPHNIACALEAFIGALFLDGGQREARKFVLNIFSPELKLLEQGALEHDYKSILQEYGLKKFKVLPHYYVIREEGPDHKKTFDVGVSLSGRPLSKGHGRNKKTAEQHCAKLALEKLGFNLEKKIE